METIWLFAALIKVIYKLVVGLHVCENATLGEIRTRLFLGEGVSFWKDISKPQSHIVGILG